jgi:hypothetical protein
VAIVDLRVIGVPFPPTSPGGTLRVDPCLPLGLACRDTVKGSLKDQCMAAAGLAALGSSGISSPLSDRSKLRRAPGIPGTPNRSARDAT